MSLPLVGIPIRTMNNLMPPIHQCRKVGKKRFARRLIEPY